MWSVFVSGRHIIIFLVNDAHCTKLHVCQQTWMTDQLSQRGRTTLRVVVNVAKSLRVI